MLKPCPSRWYYFVNFLMVAGLLFFAYYLEFYQGQLPCALCEVQRLIFALLGGLFLIATALPLRKRIQIVANLLLCLTTVLGLIFAGRQVLLQYFPSQVPSGACDASLYYLLKIMPWPDVISSVFWGGPECAKITWQFLYLSIAGWSLIWFVLFFLETLSQLLGWIFSRA
jgi:disulfide bond formation protein DsbB